MIGFRAASFCARQFLAFSTKVAPTSRNKGRIAAIFGNLVGINTKWLEFSYSMAQT
jgi:hypothetical protein